MTRVLIYIDSLKAGGAERVALQFASWLKESGHVPIVLTRRAAGDDFYPCPAGLLRLVEAADPPWLRRLSWLGFPWRLLRLRRLLRLHSIELGLALTTLPAIKLILAAVGLGLPVVASERNYPPARPLPLPWRVLRRLAYPRACLHLVQTEAIASWLRQHRLAGRCFVLANAVVWPLPCFTPSVAPQEWMAPDEHMLLAVGTKSHQKGFDQLVQAFCSLSPRFPTWRLVILGLSSDPYHGVDQVASLKASIPQSIARASKILFPGRIGNVADWYDRADVFVLSSRYEGFPNVLLEAMAGGVACVAVDCPTGPAEILEDGVNGSLCRSDPAALVDAISLLMSHDDLRRRYGQAALTVRDRFSVSRQRRLFLSALDPWLEAEDPSS